MTPFYVKKVRDTKWNEVFYLFFTHGGRMTPEFVLNEAELLDLLKEIQMVQQQEKE